jgi:hypothetical protein
MIQWEPLTGTQPTSAKYETQKAGGGGYKVSTCDFFVRTGVQNVHLDRPVSVSVFEETERLRRAVEPVAGDLSNRTNFQN